MKDTLEYLRKMKFGSLFIIFLGLYGMPVYSQFSADFSDGSLEVWQGDKTNFIINPNLQLQLNAPGGSTNSWIYTPVSYIDSMVWEVYFKLDFGPSTSNQLRIYLGVNSSDLATASGYYLEIGATGDQDPIELKYLNNGVGESLASSAPGIAGTEPVEFTLRITRNGSGLWQCYSIGETLPELLFTTTHILLPLPALSLFGFNCKYTDTRRDKFFFDDISIQPILPDVTAPTCIAITVKDANSVELLFDESLDAASALVAGNYILNPGNRLPDVVEYEEPNIILHWNTPFVSLQAYTLTIEQVKDVAGNVMLPDQKIFTYISIENALPYELLITEIMADPTPVIALPDAEYIELYNASDHVFNLSDYTLVVGSSERSFPDELILSHEYVIVCDEDTAPLFSGIGRTIAVSNFPSLTNGGATLMIKNSEDVILHDVTYSSTWYVDPGKAAGGWALEMINPLHICSDMTNWAEANNLTGGTPGKTNSQWSMSEDNQGPDFQSLFIPAADKIILRFNERLDPLLMENPAAYTIFPAVSISIASLQDPMTIELTLSESLEPGIVYRLIPFDAFDCLGNLATIGDTLSFGLTVAPEKGDIIINELLFNPVSGGSRYIEIRNVSQKFINLSSIVIGRISTTGNDLYPTGIDETIGPDQLAVFSPEPSDILSRYQVPQPSRLFESTLPSWDEDTDNVAILYGGEVLDSVTYFSSWHLPVIADQNGVSLERISATALTSSPSTWHSASSVSGNGTPTGTNSQNVNLEPASETPFTINNGRFSPNGDGYRDFLALNFLSATGEDIASVWIYDLEGREINQLIANESLGTSGLVQWDGRNNDQQLAEMGIYVIFVQLWDAMGNVKEYQETCALVKR